MFIFTGRTVNGQNWLLDIGWTVTDRYRHWARECRKFSLQAIGARHPLVMDIIIAAVSVPTRKIFRILSLLEKEQQESSCYFCSSRKTFRPPTQRLGTRVQRYPRTWSYTNRENYVTQGDSHKPDQIAQPYLFSNLVDALRHYSFRV